VIDTNVFELSQPGTFADPLTEVLRNGARALLAQAVEAEVAALLSHHTEQLTDDGCQRLVRHGHLPEREIMTGIGPVALHCPRVRDRVGEGRERIRFSSAILPPYAQSSTSRASPPAISRRRSSRCSAKTPAGCRPRPFLGSRRSTSGSTASTCRPASRTRRSAFWSSSAPRRKARRNSSASSMLDSAPPPVRQPVRLGFPVQHLALGGFAQAQHLGIADPALHAGGQQQLFGGVRPLGKIKSAFLWGRQKEDGPDSGWRYLGIKNATCIRRRKKRQLDLQYKVGRRRMRSVRPFLPHLVGGDRVWARSAC